MTQLQYHSVTTMNILTMGTRGSTPSMSLNTSKSNSLSSSPSFQLGNLQLALFHMKISLITSHNSITLAAKSTNSGVLINFSQDLVDIEMKTFPWKAEPRKTFSMVSDSKHESQILGWKKQWNNVNEILGHSKNGQSQSTWHSKWAEKWHSPGTSPIERLYRFLHSYRAFYRK